MIKCNPVEFQVFRTPDFSNEAQQDTGKHQREGYNVMAVTKERPIPTVLMYPVTLVPRVGYLEVLYVLPDYSPRRAAFTLATISYDTTVVRISIYSYAFEYYSGA